MFNRWSALTLIVLFTLQGCSISNTKEQVVLTDVQVFSGSENFWVQEEADKAIKEKMVGHIASRALVPLVFNDVGHLLTPTEYNAGLQKVQPSWETYFTDLDTFRDVMMKLIADGSQTSERLETAIEVNTVQLPADETGTILIYVYDPYELTYRSD